jgi:hypothetical protein
MAFEIVDMSLDERGKYRRLLVDSRSSTSITAETDAAGLDAELPVAR